MTLPISGPISASDMNVELGLSPTATTSLNDTAVRALFERSSGEISYEHGRGKSTSIYIPYNPPGGTVSGSNYRTLAIAAGWNQNSYVEVTIVPGTVIYSTSSSIPSFTIDGPFPNGAKLINNGSIYGKGGDGGNGDGGYGIGGGTAISISAAIIIENNGTIAGGGGGGGAGGAGLGATGGGGGGGAGNAVGVGGSGGYYGGNGALLTGGGGGAGHGGSGKFSSSGAGGSGGGIEAAGNGGGVGQRGQAAGGGGAAGAAINGNSFVTWTAFGTRYGAIN